MNCNPDATLFVNSLQYQVLESIAEYDQVAIHQPWKL